MISYLRTINHTPNLLISFDEIFPQREKMRIFNYMVVVKGIHKPNHRVMMENVSEEMIK